MPQLPKIVQERLRASTAAVGHPDPDVLTAFSEQSLPESERALVIEHLARCGDCREIVALALPAAEEVEAPRVATPGRSWLTWPGLRWGVVAAGVVIFCSFGVLQYLKHPAAMTVASQKNPRNEVAAYSVQPASPPQAKEPEQERDKDKRPEPKQDTLLVSPGDHTLALGKPAPVTGGALGLAGKGDRARTLGAVAGAGGGMGGGAGFRHGPKIAMATPPPGMAPTSDFKSNATFPPRRVPPASAAQQNAPVPPVSEAVEVQGQAQTQVQTEVASAQIQSGDQNQQQGLQNGTQQQQQIASNLDQEVLKAKPSVDAQTGAGVAPARSPASSGAPQGPAVGGLINEGRNNLQLPYQWTIDSSGALQRSFDLGKTWQNVAVDEGSASSFSYLTDQTVAKQAKVSRAEKKQKEKEAAANRQFRAVVAAGPEVWAGGSGGMLYHSVDGGEHWARIVLQAAGVVFTGDIVSVEFSDLLHGRITTSTSQVWTTMDGGKSWQH